MESEGRRIAVVQHGDYWDALRIVSSGNAEPYFGMRHSVESLQELFGSDPYLLISLDAPASRHKVGTGEVLSFPMKRWKGVPGRISAWMWARQICRELDKFSPTHLLVRSGGPLALWLMRFGINRGWSVLPLFAGTFDNSSKTGRRVNQKLARLSNHPSIFLAANHRRAATESMIEFGVNPSRAVAYDWPGAREPSHYASKRFTRGQVCRILYAATMVESKGIGDLIHAASRLAQRGINLRLTAFGVGPLHQQMRELAARLLPGTAEFPGRVPNDALFAAMRECTLVCVPSRYDWPEGGSLTLTEALASRSPVVLSDQPLFKRAYQNGRGVQFFRAGDPESLAEALGAVIADEETYAQLSEATQHAFGAVECKVSMGDILRRWRASMNSNQSALDLSSNFSTPQTIGAK